MKTLQGRYALVTGAASGIGRAISLELAAAGAQLYLVDVDAPPLEHVAETIRRRGVQAVTRICDVGDPRQVDACVEHLREKWGRLHVLVNNAGILYYGKTEHMTARQWNRLTAVNFLGPVQFVHRLLPMLLAEEEAHILNVCSHAGLIPKRKMAAYQASKFALVGLSQSLRAEFATRGLGVTALCPGLVETQLVERARETGRLTVPLRLPALLTTTPEHVARRAVRAIRRNHNIVPVTAFTNILWILHRLAPNLLDRYLHRATRRKEKRQPAASPTSITHTTSSQRPAVSPLSSPSALRQLTVHD